MGSVSSWEAPPSIEPMVPGHGGPTPIDQVVRSHRWSVCQAA
jgi:hypothetical protein